jgi:hypothetical protein
MKKMSALVRAMDLMILSVDDMIETAYAMMNEYNPARFPGFYE